MTEELPTPDFILRGAIGYLAIRFYFQPELSQADKTRVRDAVHEATQYGEPVQSLDDLTRLIEGLGFEAAGLDLPDYIPGTVARMTVFPAGSREALEAWRREFLAEFEREKAEQEKPDPA